MNKFLLKISGLFSLLGLGMLFFAFTPSGGEEFGDTYLDTRGCELSVSFVENVSSRVKIPEGDFKNLHAFDHLNMRNVSESYQINRCYDARNQLSQEKVLLNSTKTPHSWRDPVTRVLKNPDGIQLYSSRGKMVKQIPLSRAQLGLNEAESKVRANLLKQGKTVFPVTITEEDIKKADRDTKIIRLKEGGLSVKKDFYLKTSGTQIEELTEYRQVGRDLFVPVKVQTKKLMSSTFSGTCMEKIETKTYTDYVINGQRVR